MGFLRVLNKQEGGLPGILRAGDGYVANVNVKDYAAETNETITIAELSGGSLQQGTTLTSDVTYTLPTAAIITAEWPEMDVGDSYVFEVTNAQAGAFDVVIAVGAGITKVGANNTLSVPPQASRMYKLVKTAAATYNLF